jgi:hypothetical protein
MPNSNLIESIHRACDKFDAGKMTLSELQQSIDGNGQALEGVDRSVYAKLHDFCNSLERIEFACLSKLQRQEGMKITDQIRDYLTDLSLG